MLNQPSKLPPKDNSMFLAGLVLVIGLSIILLLTVLLWTSKATEYSMISPENDAHCSEFARIEAMRFEDKEKATADAYVMCVLVLPTRLPLPLEPGTVPATGETWAEACDREYRTWDAATGTVIRRGSPDRVECPLTLVGGEWQLPDE